MGEQPQPVAIVLHHDAERLAQVCVCACVNVYVRACARVRACVRLHASARETRAQGQHMLVCSLHAWGPVDVRTHARMHAICRVWQTHGCMHSVHAWVRAPISSTQNITCDATTHTTTSGGGWQPVPRGAGGPAGLRRPHPRPAGAAGGLPGVLARGAEGGVHLVQGGGGGEGGDGRGARRSGRERPRPGLGDGQPTRTLAPTLPRSPSRPPAP